MKKVILLVTAFVAISMTSNAQLFFGGNAGFSIGSVNSLYDFSFSDDDWDDDDDDWDDDDDDDDWDGDGKTLTFSINPQIGYQITDELAVGAYVGLNISTITGEKYHTTSWRVAPFVRYAFAELGDFSVLGEAVVDMGNSSVKYDGHKISGDMQFAVYVRPVLQYEISKSFALELGMNFATLGFYHYGEENNLFKLGAETTGSTIGFIYKL